MSATVIAAGEAAVNKTAQVSALRKTPFKSRETINKQTDS